MSVMVKVIGPGVKVISQSKYEEVSFLEKLEKVIRNFPSPKNSALQLPLKLKPKIACG